MAQSHACCVEVRDTRVREESRDDHTLLDPKKMSVRRNSDGRNTW